MRLASTRQNLGLSVLLVILVGVVSLLVRPLLPVDETRYVAVAWEMWSHDSWWLPTLNGAPYAHKPPLLFWLMHLGWSVAGVNEWWPRMLGALLAAANLLLVKRLADGLWPQRPETSALASIVYMSSWYALALVTALMFDMLMTLCVLLALCGLVEADRGRRSGWGLYALGIALGLLCKGPVVLVYTLPAALAQPWWSAAGGARGRWYLGVVGGLVLACVPILIWLYEVNTLAGEGHLRELVLKQTLARVSGEMGHGRPLWWYLPWLILLPMPWLLWPGLWRGLRALKRKAEIDRGLRLLVVAIVAALILLSAVGGKQVHYLLPVWALAAAAFARILAESGPLRARDLRAQLLALAIPVLLMWLPLQFKDADTDALLVQMRPAYSLSMLALGIFVVYAWQRLSPYRIVQVVATGVVASLFVCAFAVLGPRFDLAPAATAISNAQIAGRDVAFIGKYQGEFGFLGRLSARIDPIETWQISAWAQTHPQGLLICRKNDVELGTATVEHHQRYRETELLLLGAEQFNTGRAVPVVR